MLYRVRRPLRAGSKIIPTGSVTQLDLAADSIARLLAVGAIKQVAAPPAWVLPELKPYEQALRDAGLLTADSVVEASAARLAKALGLSQAKARKLQEAARDWLTAPE